jgi:hypothetical protein
VGADTEDADLTSRREGDIRADLLVMTRAPSCSHRSSTSSQTAAEIAARLLARAGRGGSSVQRNVMIEALAGDGVQPLVLPDATPNKPRLGRFGGIDGWMRTSWPPGAGARSSAAASDDRAVFANLERNRGANRFQRRGRAACRSEGPLLAATHNLKHYQVLTRGLNGRPCRR